MLQSSCCKQVPVGQSLPILLQLGQDSKHRNTSLPFHTLFGDLVTQVINHLLHPRFVVSNNYFNYAQI